MDTLQFYPTPPLIAARAWAKFKNRDFSRVLEPSAGKGDLAMANSGTSIYRKVMPDCCEIDVAHHAALREQGLAVVGLDFMQMKSASIYSHIIMNPPFNMGAHHVLKAWELMWDGEIVAILNAETVRNACSKERELLVKLILHHGSVEYIEGAFSKGQGAERPTDVDVALVYLRKTANVSKDIVGPILEELKGDSVSGEGLAEGYQDGQQLALSNSYIENQVAAFNAAVRAMQEAVRFEARSQYYARLVGQPMAVLNGEGAGIPADTSVEYVRKEMGERYDNLKDRAWAGIIRSANVTTKLSSAAQKKVEKEFEQIKKLEFTVQSIYGFLCGIVESQGEIQLQMCCDVFDEITKYHSDNAVFYKGWKSNDRHRSAGMRIKLTRFILPRNSGWNGRLDWDAQRRLADIDKVFAMLDGKAVPEVALTDLFHDASESFSELRRGGRLSSSYFDVRYYPGAGTIHFFPRDKKLIDRLNRLVGRQRAWLPPEGARVSDAFWLAYDSAEKFDVELRKEVSAIAGRYQNPLGAFGSRDDDIHRDACATINQAMDSVLKRHGIDVDFQLENHQQDLLLLAA